jgi:hypothetical protein
VVGGERNQGFGSSADFSQVADSRNFRASANAKQKDFLCTTKATVSHILSFDNLFVPGNVLLSIGGGVSLYSCSMARLTFANRSWGNHAGSTPNPLTKSPRGQEIRLAVY